MVAAVVSAGTGERASTSGPALDDGADRSPLRLVAEVVKFRYLLSQLVRQHVTARYRRTILGFLWTLVNPLLTMAITATVFSLVLGLDIREFSVFLFAGNVPWTLIYGCATRASGAIVANEGLIKKIYVPQQIFPISASLGMLIDTIFSMGSLLVIALLVGAKASLALLFLPISLLILYGFCVGLTLTFSVLFVYFRDMEHITTVILQGVYYLTPILYPLTRIPEKYVWIFYLNPLVYFIELFRNPICYQALPSVQALAVCGVSTVLMLLVANWTFLRCQRDLIFRL